MGGLDRFETIGKHLLRCKDCGQEVPSGIMNISEHWTKCGGKQQMDNIMKINDMPLHINDKMDLVKKEMNIDQ